MQNDATLNEQAFLDLVNSIIGQPTNTMDPCFDASVVERYLEQNSINRKYVLGSKTVEIGRQGIANRGLAHYVCIEAPDEFKKYILWPSTSLGDGHDGLRLYFSYNLDIEDSVEVDNDQISDLIFTLADLAAEQHV